MRGVFSDYKIAILNEWSKQWSQYQHSWQSEVTHILKSSILNELEDYLQQITTRGVFSDYKIAILNEWSKQWSQYQHSWQSEVTHILKSSILNELEDYLHK